MVIIILNFLYKDINLMYEYFSQISPFLRGDKSGKYPNI